MGLWAREAEASTPMEYPGWGRPCFPKFLSPTGAELSRGQMLMAQQGDGGGMHGAWLELMEKSFKEVGPLG